MVMLTVYVNKNHTKFLMDYIKSNKIYNLTGRYMPLTELISNLVADSVEKLQKEVEDE